MNVDFGRLRLVESGFVLVFKAEGIAYAAKIFFTLWVKNLDRAGILDLAGNPGRAARSGGARARNPRESSLPPPTCEGLATALRGAVDTERESSVSTAHPRQPLLDITMERQEFAEIAEKPARHHAPGFVWHGFVLSGSALHVASIAFMVT